MIDPLDDRQRAAAAALLDEEERERRHLVVSLSGAHAYGFPSPDSDLDLKAIHVDPTPRWLGLSPVATTASRMEVRDGVELDYGSNEIQPVLVGALAGNGNYVERILGAIPLREAPELASLRPVVARSLSRRIHRHYRGFATAQRGELAAQPTVKRVLYVLRTTLTGAHVLATGRVVTDLGELAVEHGFPVALELIAAKRAGERTPLDAAGLARCAADLDRAFEHLDRARDGSPLPEAAPNPGEVDAWLVALRRSRLDR